MVTTVERQIASDLTLNHEYLPVAGLPAFRTAAVSLLLGRDNPAIIENRVSAVLKTVDIHIKNIFLKQFKM